MGNHCREEASKARTLLNILAQAAGWGLSGAERCRFASEGLRAAPGLEIQHWLQAGLQPKPQQKAAGACSGCLQTSYSPMAAWDWVPQVC